MEIKKKYRKFNYDNEAIFWGYRERIKRKDIALIIMVYELFGNDDSAINIIIYSMDQYFIYSYEKPCYRKMVDLLQREYYPYSKDIKLDWAPRHMIVYPRIFYGRDPYDERKLCTKIVQFFSEASGCLNKKIKKYIREKREDRDRGW